MLRHGRVFCDPCGEYLGQLMAAPVQAPGLLADMTKPPYLAFCPKCRASECTSVPNLLREPAHSGLSSPHFCLPSQ